ncbi:MAG: 3-dehydroquinate synthase [Opitutae bacterium]|nr:3-dehydroquinate synthase [Opitutae bacterium]
MPETLEVQLSEHRYPIHLRTGAVQQALAAAMAEVAWAGRAAAVVTDASVAKVLGVGAGGSVADVPTLVLPVGEGTKTAAQLVEVWEFLARNRVDRRGVLWAIGGGVVGDLAGFAAASYLRGIDYVQVPTTLLAMVDSSVGGKTGLNLQAGKNLAGAFHHPQAVYAFADFLRTLPAREFAAGAAEVVKYGLLADEALFAQLEAKPLTLAHPELLAIVRRCCAIKAQVVQADPRETAPEGGRALLNLGHTFGHAIENVAGYGAYLHGEAVAVGLAAAARLSRELGLIDDAAVARVERVVAAHDLPVRLREPLPLSALFAAMARDKKNRDGKLRFVVLEALGRAVTRGDVPVEPVERVWCAVGAC